MQKIKKLVGNKIYLGPISDKHIHKLVKWMNDLDVVKYTCQATKKHTDETAKKFLESSLKDLDVHYYGIFTKNGKLIGSLDLRDVDNINRTASLGIIIGEKEYWNKGLGTQSVKLLLEYGFNYLNLNNIKLTVFDFNKRAIRVYQKCGFKIIGNRRKSRFFNGKYYDEIYMDILANEFEKIK